MSGAPTKPVLDGGVSHPARFPAPILDAIDGLLGEYLPWGGRILDPFGGTGLIHKLGDKDRSTFSSELEHEWARLGDGTNLVADACELPFRDGTFDAVVTSPVYGNRLSDAFQSKDPEKRRSYTFDLGRGLTDGNAGVLHWPSHEYKQLHREAWREAVRVLRPFGVLVLNVKDHIRGGEWQDVSAWHMQQLVAAGLDLVSVRPVATRGLRAGANRQLRVGAELLVVFQTPEPF